MTAAKFFVPPPPPPLTEKRATLTIKSFSLIATVGYPSGKLQSWISSVKKPRWARAQEDRS